MICKNCANIFSDDLTVCPDCGTPIKGSAAPKADTDSREDIEKLVSLALSGDEKEPVSQTFDEGLSYDEEETDEAEASVESEAAVKNEAKEKTASQDKRKGKTEKVKLKKMTKKEKGAFNFIVSLTAVIFIVILALTGIRTGTEIFDKDGDDIKAIALSGLPSSETAGLEDYLSKIGIVAYNGYDREKDVIVDVMAYLRPHDAGGLYSRFYGNADITANEPDPNGRFRNENGDYSYFVLDSEKVDYILQTFGFSANHNVNEKDFYFYGDKYYFANKPDYAFSTDVVADVSSSKRLQDGSYYAECSFFDAGAGNADKSYLQAYIILDKYEDSQSGDIQWEVSRISHEAVFDSSGMMIKDNSGINELSFDIENKTVEAVTEDGAVYARYILEYPVFKGDTTGEKVANQLFSDLANSFSTDTEDVTKAYKKFVKNGGDADELPFVTQIVSRVTYNRNGYISIVEGISEAKPQSVYNKGDSEDAEEEEFIPVVLPERSIEGYIIEVETGDFLSKKEIIDVEYTLVHEILYRIYNGYEYESLLDENIEDTDVPEDTDGQGKTFYESASAMGYSGYVFSYVSPEGYTENIVIPYETENFFNEDFSKKTTE